MYKYNLEKNFFQSFKLKTINNNNIQYFNNKIIINIVATCRNILDLIKNPSKLKIINE